MADTSLKLTSRKSSTPQGPLDVNPADQNPGFKYSSLPEKEAVIRLLKLLPGEPEDDIRCVLNDYNLEGADQKPYEAISYVWGTEEHSTKIIVNNERVKVRQNLHLALQCLRHKYSARTVWVDAICINQNNNKERSHQVDLMRNIYQGADQVVVWLGASKKQTDIAMDSLEYMRYMLNKCGVGQKEELKRTSLSRINIHHQEAIEGFQDLLRRQWFQRAWIIQEIALARDATIMCGKKSIPAGIFSSLSWMLGKSFEISPIEPVLNVMPGFSKDTKESWWNMERDLFALLLKFRNNEATELRDKIYAFLGIASDIKDGNFEASYEIGDEELVQDVVSFLSFGVKIDRSLFSAPRWTLHDFFKNLAFLPFIVSDGVNQSTTVSPEALKILCTTRSTIVDHAHARRTRISTGGEIEAFITLSKNSKESHSIQNGTRTVCQVIFSHLFESNYPSWNNDGGFELLLKAAKEGHVVITRHLLSTIIVGGNSKGNDGRTPLWWAAANGHEAIVKLLLDTGKVNVNSKDNYDRTPLSSAAEHGHEGVIKLLLETGQVDANSKDNDDMTPLSSAAEHGHEGVIKLLLETGLVDADLKDKDGWRPLWRAAANGHEGAVKLLLETGQVDADSMDIYGWTTLSRAAANGHEGVVKLLLETGQVDADSKYNYYGWTPLSRAAENGHDGIVKLLLGTGQVDADSMDMYGMTPLWRATANGHEGAVKLLLETGQVDADPKDNDGGTPLWRAVTCGYEGVVKLLLGTGQVDADSKNSFFGETPLSRAAANGHEAIIKLLLDTGQVDANSKGMCGRTPLWWAAVNGHEAIVKLLLDTGNVDADSKDDYGRTPLSMTAMNGQEAIVKLLQQKGC